MKKKNFALEKIDLRELEVSTELYIKSRSRPAPADTIFAPAHSHSGNMFYHSRTSGFLSYVNEYNHKEELGK